MTTVKTEAAFTPGPWLQGTGSGGGATTYVYEYGRGGQQCRAIAACTMDFVSRPFDEREANARLIAAAPDLYELAETVEAGRDNLPGWLVDMAAAALARARGDAPSSKGLAE